MGGKWVKNEAGMVSGPGADDRVVFIARFKSVRVKSLLYQGVEFGFKGRAWVLGSCVIGVVAGGGPVNSLAKVLATSTGSVRMLSPTVSKMAVGGGEVLSRRILFQILVVVAVLFSDFMNSVQLSFLACKAVCRNRAVARL